MYLVTFDMTIHMINYIINIHFKIHYSYITVCYKAKFIVYVLLINAKSEAVKIKSHYC